MIRFLVLICCLFTVTSAIAVEDYHSIALKAESDSEKAMAPYIKDAISARDKMTLIKNAQMKTKQDNKQYPSVIVFISFSMPEQSLIAIIHDANKIGASVVIRGLVNNSFKETFVKVTNLVKQSKGGGVELNPPLFKKFHVESVPATVILPSTNICITESSCKSDDFDVVYGDIPLIDALKMIRDHGDVSKLKAAELLSQGGSYNA